MRSFEVSSSSQIINNNVGHGFCFGIMTSFFYIFFKYVLRVKPKLWVIKMSRQQIKTRFTMHSNAHQMLSKFAVTMPFGTGVFFVCHNRNNSIHSFINQTHSL